MFVLVVPVVFVLVFVSVFVLVFLNIVLLFVLNPPTVPPSPIKNVPKLPVCLVVFVFVLAKNAV